MTRREKPWLSVNPNNQLQTDAMLVSIKKISSNASLSDTSTSHLVTSLLDALMKCEDCVTAELIFTKMERSVITYGCLMSGFNHNNQPEKTLDLFYRMKTESIELNSVVYLSVIKALAQLGVSSLSTTIVDQMPVVHLQNDWIQNALIDMWVSLSRQQRLSYDLLTWICVG
jgi:pentatricopeptide repeat protein